MVEPLEQSREPLSFDDLRAVLGITVRAGLLMLEYGAGALRTEETMQRMGATLGIERLEIFITPTAIIATAESGDQHRTLIRRVAFSAVNLSLIDAINRLSRRMSGSPLSRAEVRAEIERIAGTPRVYNRWLAIGAAATAAGSFGVLNGGGPPEAVCVCVGAAAALLTRQALGRRGASALLQVPPAAFMGAGLVVLLASLIGAEPDIAVPSSIIPLIPGVPLITALLDLLHGYPVSGVSRLVQALLIVIEIAVGVALALDLARFAGLGV